VGYETWENIWGIWNQIPDRDAEAIRRIAKIERKFASALVSPQWEPHTPVLRPTIYASKFPSGSITVWTFVNRNEYTVDDAQISIPAQSGARYYDLWNGVELKPDIHDSKATLSFPIEAHGYGAMLAATGPVQDLDSFLSTMRELAKRPLASYSEERKVLPQKVVDIARAPAKTSAPEGMLKIPAGNFRFRISGIMIEGKNEIGVDLQYAWEDSPRRHHDHTMNVDSFYIDRYPVTNEQFYKFVTAAKYHPKDDHNFLRDWKNGKYPDGFANKPVTWVSIEDARAYAAWAGKRLPHEWEWQYAAQGTDGRAYPWGNDWNEAAAPVPDRGRTMNPPSDVNAHPKGASPFGVEDLVGNVWQWTDEYLDDHTRTGILRGGSHYQPQGSHWYFPQAYRLDEHGKYLLIAPSKDRSGGVGFRCAQDLP
jgi:formylglycine-generating enzyme required for sulfatase activity